MPVETAPEAATELHRAALRLERARTGYGDRIRAAFVRAVRDLDRDPRVFPPVDNAPAGVEVRYVHLKRYGYQVVFAVFGELKLILAVAHDSQDPGYWIDRLPSAT
jgi:hypothetical protein